MAEVAYERENKRTPACPVETTLTLIGDKWKVLILKGFNVRNKAFWRVEKSIGTVSQKVLTAQLRDMGSERTCAQRCIYRSSAKSGIFFDGIGSKSQTDT